MNDCLNDAARCECFTIAKNVNGHGLCYEYDCMTDMFVFNCISCGVVEPLSDEDRQSIETVFRFSRIHAGGV